MSGPVRSPSLREKADYDKRIDALLDEMTRIKVQLAVCEELSTPNPIELDIQGRTLDTCVEALTRAHGKLLAVAKYVQDCKTYYRVPTVWELELILDDIVPRGPIL